MNSDKSVSLNASASSLFATGAVALCIVFTTSLPSFSNPVPFTVDQIKAKSNGDKAKANTGNAGSPSEKPEQLFKEAKNLAAHGEIEKAMQAYSEIVARYPQLPGAYLGRAKAYLELGKADLAMKDLDTAVKYDVTMNSWALRDRGNLLQKFHRYEDAIKDFDRMLAKHQDSSVYADRATCYMRLKKYSQAIEDFTHALKLRCAKRTSTLAKRGDCYLALKQHEKALSDYDSVLREDPEGDRSLDNHAKVHESRAECFQKLGKPELAKKEREIAAHARNEMIDLAPFTLEKKH